MKELLRDKRFFIPAIIFSLAETLYPLLKLFRALALFDGYIPGIYYINLLSSVLISLCVLTAIIFSILKMRKKSVYFSIAALFIKIYILALFNLGIHSSVSDILFMFINRFQIFIPLIVLLVFSVLQIKSSRIRRLFILIPFSLSVFPDMFYTIHDIINDGFTKESIPAALLSLLRICCIYGCFYYYERQFFSREYYIKDTPHIPVSYLEQYKQNLEKGGK